MCRADSAGHVHCCVKATLKLKISIAANRIDSSTTVIIHICTFKITSAQQEASNIFHTLPLTTHLPQNALLTLLLEMNPKLKKQQLCFSKAIQMPTSQQDTSYFTKLLLWKHLQQARKEQRGDCHRPVVGPCFKLTYLSVSSKLLFNVPLDRNHLSTLILQIVGAKANALVPSVRKTSCSAVDRQTPPAVCQPRAAPLSEQQVPTHPPSRADTKAEGIFPRRLFCFQSTFRKELSQ